MAGVETIGTVLVANRGEIAVRVIRTLRAMGIRSVAVYSEADADARHVRDADIAVLLGPAPARDSYLDIDRIIDAARRTGVDAVHPGYGFLSENAAFAAACAAAGIAFIGPSVAAIEVMGDKITAKNTVASFGVPVVPGIAEPGLTDIDLVTAATEIGYPVLVKPAAGGGGKGMRLVEVAAELPAALVSARREAAAAFGDDTLFLERFVQWPRHIEVQVLADRYGNTVHLGERECSLQRRHQKVIEEAPSPLLDAATRARIGEAACATARSVDYLGAGTVEFIVSADRPDEFFFMEMNTRLQVEHPVTELVTGVDLVEWQVRIARGEKLTIVADQVKLLGHAIEARVYAEDPARGFLPTGGTVLQLAEPSGHGVRVDSGLSVGATVGSAYDPMLAKVIAYSPGTRAEALGLLDRALGETVVLGVTTNIEFLRFLLADPDVVAGQLDTGLLDRRVTDFAARRPPDEVLIAAAADQWLRRWSDSSTDPWTVPSGWRIGGAVPTSIRLAAADRTAVLRAGPDGDREHCAVRITGRPGSAVVSVDDGRGQAMSVTRARASGATGDAEASGATGDVGASDATGDVLVLTLDGVRSTHRVATQAGHIWVAFAGNVFALREWHAEDEVTAVGHDGVADILSPMPGSVIAAPVGAGAFVEAGTTIVVVEAMKMEHALTAPVAGVVELRVAEGDQVKVDQLLAKVVPAGNESEGAAP